MFPSCQKALVISANPTLQTQVVFQHKFQTREARRSERHCWEMLAFSSKHVCRRRKRNQKERKQTICVASSQQIHVNQPILIFDLALPDPSLSFLLVLSQGSFTCLMLTITLWSNQQMMHALKVFR